MGQAVSSAQARLGTILTAALRYAERGVNVFPCGPDKRPLTEHGFKDASTDEQQIKAWWRRWPDALIGMPTGRASGLIVIDLDVREGYDGAEALANIEEAYGKLPDTIEALTAGGGRHLYWRHPGWDVRNSASKLGLGIDVRGDGGYVIVPPSRLPDGRRYEWEASSTKQAAEMPAWALRLLGAKVEPRSVSDTQMSQGAQSGQRNVYLASIAGRLAHAGLSRDQVRAMVLAENARSCSPPLADDEIDRTVMKSASKWVMAAAESADTAPESPEATQGLRWYPADQWLRQLSMPRWVIRDYLEAGTLNVTIGGWGAGKSVVELDRALCACHGLVWQQVPIDPVVWVYVAGEGQRGFMRRIAAWHTRRGLSPTDRLIVIPEAVLLGQPDHEAALGQALVEIQQHTGEAIAAVTLDTMARCFGLESESDNSDIARWVGSLQRHIIEPTGAAVSVLHHPGHGDKTRGRGGSALPGAADTEWLLERTGNVVTLSCNKNKDGEPPPALAWRLLGIDIDINGEVCKAVTVEEQGEAVQEAPALPFGSLQEAAWQTLVAMYDEAAANLAEQSRPAHEAHVDEASWRKRCEELGLVKNRKRWPEAVAALREKGAIDTSQAPRIYPAGWAPVPF